MNRRRTHRPSMRWMLPTLVAACLALTSCGGSGADGAAEPARQRSATLVAQKIDGGQIDIADLLGQDVVLWFWAPW